MPNLTYSNYVYTFSTPNMPYISANVYTETEASFTTSTTGAKDVYLAAATAYANEYLTIIQKKNYVLDRFEKDALANVGLATIVRNTNTYVANVKADDFYTEASLNLILSNTTNLTAAYTNLERLYANLFLAEGSSSGDPLTSETEDPATYDTLSVIHSTDIFIMDAPKAVGTARTYTSYDAAEAGEFILKYDSVSSLWFIAEYGDVNETKLFTCPNIDAAIPEWSEVTESSTSSSSL